MISLNSFKRLLSALQTRLVLLEVGTAFLDVVYILKVQYMCGR
jgi:hypothetical protein